MNPVRFGIVGLGMGGEHAHTLTEGKVRGGVLTAVCDIDAERAAKFPHVQQFTKADDMYASGAVDAVVIATPHYSHPDLSVAALGRGLHVMVEKPIAVHKQEAERLIRAARPAGPLLAVMLNQRTDPRYQRMREIVQRGELGRLQRITWIITDWFRTEAYFKNGVWRGTWAGEGGGLLMNQCPHQLDLLQWVFGMPRAVRAWCGLGKRHAIEVEDEVTAYLEYDDGATGLFVASTGEAPGVNRLEAAGELGRLVLEGNKIDWVRNVVSAAEHSRSAESGFEVPEHARETLMFDGNGAQHVGILQNFVEAIHGEAAVIAPGSDGLASVELANAMLLSSVRSETITLPLSGEVFASTLEALKDEASRRKGAKRK